MFGRDGHYCVSILRGRSRRPIQRALVHPAIDYEKLASALLEHADNELRRQAEDNSKAA